MIKNNPNSSLDQRLVSLVTRTNWILYAALVISGLILMDAGFVWGIICGGLIVTVNFHLLSRTLKKTFQMSFKPSSGLVILKYFFRFILIGLILYLLISNHMVDPLGLVTGLSVVVASMMVATLYAIKNLLSGEAI
ncbi:MAG: ATP synthase subunit I [Desulfosudaceae bacterium]